MFVLTVGYASAYDLSGIGGASYNSLWNNLDLSDLDLYRLQQLGGGDRRANGYYDDDLDSRSTADSDWSMLNYRDTPSNDGNDMFSEASIRDQEYQEQSPLWGYQSVSGK